MPIRIRTAVDDSSNAVAEAAPNFGAGGRAALVFDGVVKQRRDSFVFVASVFDDEPGDREQVRNVGHTGALAPLLLMELRGKDQGLFKSFGQRHGRCSARG